MRLETLIEYHNKGRYFNRGTKEVTGIMDITSAVARTSMEMASARVTAEVQTAMLKTVMEVQQESLAVLLKSLGVGKALDLQG